MNNKLIQLADKRQKLIAQAAEQRLAIRRDFAPWQTPLRLASSGLNAVRYVKGNPALMMGAMALFGMLRPTRVGKWVHGGWVLLKVARNWLSKKKA